ncbi:unnamed protein product [Rotaria sordida]|uniref:Uncharacterized protein n=1 Tax=Rotaria sordida TaxID=392033 RepID=A0A815RS11_9BILA|nr:unnamed protein product [Rotaria sordida]CAF1514127.1 unnamed protein product [Rotaria sordida]CAF3902727.1 unnamed protein product [Rotaria sordida]CAF4148304.1 unnamed protein product [Rotaria sordida]
MRQKSLIRDNTRCQNLKGDSLERLRIRQQTSFKIISNRQSFGKAVKHVIQSLPQDTDKHFTLVRHIAQELNVIPKTITQHQRQQRPLPIELHELIIKFYNRDDISY